MLKYNFSNIFIINRSRLIFRVITISLVLSCQWLLHLNAAQRAGIFYKKKKKKKTLNVQCTSVDTFSDNLLIYQWESELKWGWSFIMKTRMTQEFLLFIGWILLFVGWYLHWAFVSSCFTLVRTDKIDNIAHAMIN